MGLDIVEMCMDIEEAFGIDVPDEEWQEATTVGRAYETICRHLNIPVAEVYEDMAEWKRLLDVIHRSTAVNRMDLHWHADFVRDLRLD